MTIFRAVLMDFDGVIGNTAQDFLNAWRAAFKPINLQFHDQDCLVLEGQRGIEIAAQLLTRGGHDPGRAAEFKRAKDDYYAKHNSFSFYPGVPELLTLLRQKGIKCALVSGGSGPKTLQPPHDQLLRLFDVVLSGQDVREAKPAPDLFLSAAAKLKLTPQECLVIENAPLGIEAANRAGMQCIGVTSTLDSKLLIGANLVIPSIEKLHELLIFANSATPSGLSVRGLE
ncbi:MAG: HAD family phosphatase [Oligoflexia bacterium]|nr:HAD family phosphatase [Oligoflexia bacterium]